MYDSSPIANTQNLPNIASNGSLFRERYREEREERREDVA
jgi:hypothetical protein